jgi:molybdopterin-synthase adenylyltransferase
MPIQTEIFARNTMCWGERKQRQLTESAVLIAGVGGLGCVVSEVLVRAGIGQLFLVDQGIIDEPDLNRQALYTVHDLGKIKVDVAREKLAAMTTLTEIVSLNLAINADLPTNLASYRFDGIADCLDNFPSRFHLETALRREMFLVHGGVREDYGQITTIVENQTMPLKDLYATLTESTDPIPVSAPIVFCVGSIMAHEILKNLWHEPELVNQLLIVELADFSFSKIQLAPQREAETLRPRSKRG